MISFDDVTRENIKESNSNWLQIPGNPYRISIIGDLVYEKANVLLHIINHKLYTIKICLYAKDQYQAKYQLLINKQ